MIIEEIIQEFEDKPYLIDMGKGKLSKGQLKKYSPEDIAKAKKVLRKRWKKEKSLEDIHTPRILLLDIETAPIRAYVWNTWKENINDKQIISDWFVLTWSAKWLFDDKVYSERLDPEEAINEDDERIIKGIWNLMDEADVVIAHNGNKFDIPRLNTRFLIHGYGPPMSYHSIDTLSVCQRNFSFTKNKLDYINKILGIQRKVENAGFPLWEGCMLGYEESLKEETTVILPSNSEFFKYLDQPVE